MIKAITGFLLPMVNAHPYAAIFGILYVCGLGVPIPEEITLLLSGYAAYHGKVNLYGVMVLCVVAILAGDLTMFLIARHYGESLLKTRFFRWALPPARLDRVRGYMDRHGTKTVFFARFFAGIRMPVYVLAGTTRMHPVRFILLDLAGALISGPTSVYVAYRFSDDFDRAMSKVSNANHWIFGGVLVIVALTVAWHLWKGHRERTAGKAEGAAPPAGPATGPAPGTPPAAEDAP